MTCHQARLRAILLHYLETLLEWSDAVMRRDSPEEFQQAMVLLETMRHIMGPNPHKVKNPAKVKQTVATFDPLPAPINPRLMMLYDRLDDRMALIRDRSSARRYREASEKRDTQYWGNDPVRDGWRSDDERVLRCRWLVRSSQPLPLRVPDSESQGADRAGTRAGRGALVGIREG